MTRPKATSASDASPVIMATHDRSVLFLTVLALGLRFIIEGPRKPLKVVRCAGFVVLGAKVMEAKVEEMDRFDFCLLVEEDFLGPNLFAAMLYSHLLSFRELVFTSGWNYFF